MSIHQRYEKESWCSMFLQNTLPLWDTFKAQAADLVNAKLDELDIERVMLPKNMTHLL